MGQAVVAVLFRSTMQELVCR